jgi:hypothetical protein
MTHLTILLLLHVYLLPQVHIYQAPETKVTYQTFKLINNAMILSQEHEKNFMRNLEVWMETENALKCYKELFNQKLMKATEVSIKRFFKQQDPVSTSLHPLL